MTTLSLNKKMLLNWKTSIKLEAYGLVMSWTTNRCLFKERAFSNTHLPYKKMTQGRTLLRFILHNGNLPMGAVLICKLYPQVRAALLGRASILPVMAGSSCVTVLRGTKDVYYPGFVAAWPLPQNISQPMDLHPS